MTTRYGFGFGALVLAALCAALAPSAAQAQADAVEAVRSRNVAVSRALEAAGDEISDATREELKDVINSLIDFPELSQRALRRHWDDRTPEEREEFIEVFRELVRNSSVRKLEVYEADSTTYEPAVTEGGETLVRTFTHEGSKSVEVVYHMHRVDGEWKAWDVVIDGSSTMRTYMDSFNQQIRRGSFREMLDKMIDKLERDRTANGDVTPP